MKMSFLNIDWRHIFSLGLGFYSGKFAARQWDILKFQGLLLFYIKYSSFSYNELISNFIFLKLLDFLLNEYDIHQ